MFRGREKELSELNRLYTQKLLKRRCIFEKKKMQWNLVYLIFQKRIYRNAAGRSTWKPAFDTGNDRRDFGKLSLLDSEQIVMRKASWIEKSK